MDKLTALCAVALCAVIGTPAAFAQTVTGCLKDGDLKSVAVGGAPALPCAVDQTQVTFGAQGATGPAGADGADGADGAAGADGADGAPAPGVGYEFVGFSSDLDTTTGNGVGYTGLNQRCQDAHGAAARLASTKEYILSPEAFDPAVAAWIRPELVAGGTDFSGLSGLSCNAWIGGANGLVVAVNGSIKPEPCTLSRIVACSAPGVGATFPTQPSGL